MKKMTLGAKMFSGFAVILLLLVIVAGAGWVSLQAVAGRVENREDVNKIAALMAEARRNEKNFIIRGDKQSATAALENAERIKAQALATKDVFSDETNRRQMDQVVAAAENYEKVFAGYVAMGEKRDQVMEDMRVKARQALADTEAIVVDQQKQLVESMAADKTAMDQLLAREHTPEEMAALRAKSESFTAAKLANLRDANQMVEWFLEARKAEKEYIISHGEQKWHEENEKLIDQTIALAKAMEARLVQQAHKDQMAGIASALHDYHENFDEYSELIGQQKQADQAMIAAARQTQEMCAAALEDQKGKLNAASASAKLTMGGGAGVGLVAGLLLAFFITRSVTKPINEVIRGLSNGSAQVAAAAGQVSGASQSLAEGASQQAASLEETSSSLEEMGSMTKHNADSARQADALTRETIATVHEAVQAMSDLRVAMDRISATSDQTSKIIKTIDEIAFQTNLLALNAAVEAARAGEAGAGFAVVADEVRNLAMRAAEAAKNTTALIEESLSNIREGSQLVGRTDDAFGRVSQSAMKVGELVGEIAAASREQAQGIEQINMAASEMDRVTQLNAANAEESAAASEELSAQAEQMLGHVNDLAALVGGASGNGASSAQYQLPPAAARPVAPAHQALPAAQSAKAVKPAATLRLPASAARSASHEVDDDSFSEF
ncbi:methyl-accepting chemotaxis protein [Desulfarculus baarsii]